MVTLDNVRVYTIEDASVKPYLTTHAVVLHFISWASESHPWHRELAVWTGSLRLVAGQLSQIVHSTGAGNELAMVGLAKAQARSASTPPNPGQSPRSDPLGNVQHIAEHV